MTDSCTPINRNYSGIHIDGKPKAKISAQGSRHFSLRRNSSFRINHLRQASGKASLFGAGIFTNRNHSAGAGAAGGVTTVRDSEFHTLLDQLAQAHDHEIAELRRGLNTSQAEARKILSEQATRPLRLSGSWVQESSERSSWSRQSRSSHKSTSSKISVKKMFSSGMKRLVGGGLAKVGTWKLSSGVNEVPVVPDSRFPEQRQVQKSMTADLLTVTTGGQANEDLLKLPNAVVKWRSNESVYPVRDDSNSQDLDDFNSKDQAVRKDKRASTLPGQDMLAAAAAACSSSALDMGVEMRASMAIPDIEDAFEESRSGSTDDELPKRDASLGPERDASLGPERDASLKSCFSLCSSHDSTDSLIRVTETAVQDASTVVSGNGLIVCPESSQKEECQVKQKRDLEQCEKGFSNGQENTSTLQLENEKDAHDLDQCETDIGKGRLSRPTLQLADEKEAMELSMNAKTSDSSTLRTSLHASPTRSLSATPKLPILAVATKKKTQEFRGGGILKQARFSDAPEADDSSGITSNKVGRSSEKTGGNVSFEAEIHQQEDEKEADQQNRDSCHEAKHFEVLDLYDLCGWEQESFKTFQQQRQQKKKETPIARGLQRELTLENLRTAVGASMSISHRETVKIRWFEWTGVSHPHSNTNFFWDCLSILLILWDVVMLPMIVFDMPGGTFVDVMAHCTASFWTLELIRQFFLGYYLRGNVVMQFTKVVKHYLRTWFVPDLALVSLDWALLIMQQSGTTRQTNFNSLVRSARYVRMLRLLRAVKANRLMKMMEDRINTEQASVIWTMAKHFCCILVLNHLIACAWYGVGVAFVERRPNWVEMFILISPEDSVGYQYSTSFHWALSHFIDSSISVQPQNIYERTFEIFILLFSLIVGATFLSSMTSAVMRLSSLAGHKTKQFWLLRRYLRESGIPTSLAIRIHNFCEHAWDNQSMGVNECNVLALELLSAPLRMELRMAIYGPRLDMHPFFVLLAKVARDNIMRRMCSEAVSRTLMAKGELLFAEGEWCSKVIAPQHGLLSYHQLSLDLPHLGVPDKHWLCETAFWTQWTHRGECLTETVAEAVAIDHETFRDILSKDPIGRFEAIVFARSYVHGLNRTDPDKISDLYQGSQHEGLWFRLAQEYGTSRPVVSAKSEHGVETAICAWHDDD